MDAGPRIDSYEWTSGRGPMLRFGPDDGPVVVLALPLFEEANRTRAFGVAILRALATRGIGGVLPELPGQGESQTPTIATDLMVMGSALAAVDASHVIAIRSGALLADDRPAWRLSPQTGPELLRELSRIKGAPLVGDPVEVAGNLLSRTLLDGLEQATVGPGRTVRLAADARVADLHLDGDPLWRRAEPGTDSALAERLAEDIAAWIAACAS